MTHLSVNLNKVALVRNARGGRAPDIVEAARLVIEAGCDGLTLHPREDARHATLDDVYLLAGLEEVRAGDIELNIEGDPRPELIQVVRDTKATQFTVVPVEPGEITTHFGWRSRADEGLLRRTIESFEGQTRISLFVDPEPEGIELAADVGADAIELHTFAYAEAFGTPRQEAELERFARAASLARERGLRVHAGHDLNLHNLPALIERLEPDEVSIGHALISDTLMLGLPTVSRQYLDAVRGKP